MKRVLRTIYQGLDDRSLSKHGEVASGRFTPADALEPVEADWAPARAFFEARQVRRADLGGAGDWTGWDAEMLSPNSPSTDTPTTPNLSYDALRQDLLMNPTLHLPHLLRALGPSSLTLYKHILGRRRVLIYTQPPVEPACVLCQVAADMCFEAQTGKGDTSAGNLKGKSPAGVRVFGVVTLHDIDRLEQASRDGRGWVACTTDAIFLEKPQHYDLLVDLTTTPTRGSRPAMSSPKVADPSSSRGINYKLSSVRFTWSDVKLVSNGIGMVRFCTHAFLSQWTELDRLIQLNSDKDFLTECCTPSTSSFYPSSKSQNKLSAITAGWTDVWRVYEDVCVICAGLWMGTWRQSTSSSRAENWGSIRLTGEDDLTNSPTRSQAYVRNVGMGIEGRPTPPGSPSIQEDGTQFYRSQRSLRRASGSSVWTWAGGRGGSSSRAQEASGVEESPDEALARRERQVMTTLALLQVFQANTDALLARLSDLLPQRAAHSHNLTAAGAGAPLVLTPKDLVSFDLGPLSGLDGRFIEWLVEVYGNGAKVVVKRNWKDVVAFLFGLS